MNTRVTSICCTALLTLILSMLLLGDINAEEKVRNGIARSVETEVLKSGSFDLPFSTTGNLEVVNQVHVTPRIAGLISKVNFDIGSRVKKGDVLFEFDDTYIKLDIESAQAAVATATANLNDVLAGVRPEDVEAARIAVETARIALEKAERDFKRSEELHQNGVLSKELFEAATTQLEMAQMSHKGAIAQYEKAKNGATATQLELLRKAVAQAETVLAKAKQQLVDASVRAPFDGIITERSVYEGSWMAPGDKTIALLDDKNLRFAVGIPERYALLVSKGLEMTVDFNGNLIRMKVDFVLPQLNPSNRTVTAYSAFDNSERNLPVGIMAEVAMQFNVTGTVVPATALVYRGSKVYICTINDSKAKFVEVKPNISSGGLVRIASDMPVGTRFVSRGASDIFEGESLTVK